ncbi:MAG: efflux RND transporter periplasmic adaptor subunit [Akkermansiaceae bacterium]|nr:efflux RND transporter periplasmic adaptor subunit [Akkermansiaceae bacterium]
MKKRWIVLLLALAGISAFAYTRIKSGGGKAEERKGNGNQPVAVTIEKVRQENVPVWLTGIGTVQASNTVTVRPRVGGALEKINFTEGAIVNAGDVIAEIDPRPFESALAQAVAKKTQDEAQLANARLEEARFSGLLRNDAVSQQQADQATATVSQLEALVKADDAAIDAAKLDLEFTKVRAPISGRTGVRLVDAGNLVTANQETGIVVITEIQPISVIFTLPQQHLAALHAATKDNAQKPRVEAMGDDSQVLGEGGLELIDNQIDTATGTIRLKATFRNENLALWPGLYVSARILVDTLADSLVVSPEVVQPGLDGQFAYLLKSDNTVEAQPITTGLRLPDGIVVREGLKAGDSVISNGHAKLRPGSKVAPQEPTKAP